MNVCHSVFIAWCRFLHPEVVSSCMYSSKTRGSVIKNQGCGWASLWASTGHGILNSFRYSSCLGYWLGCWWRESWGSCFAPNDSNAWWVAKWWILAPFIYILFTAQAVWGWGGLHQGRGGGQSHHCWDVYPWDWEITWWFAVGAVEHRVGTGVLIDIALALSLYSSMIRQVCREVIIYNRWFPTGFPQTACLLAHLR